MALAVKGVAFNLLAILERRTILVMVSIYSDSNNLKPVLNLLEGVVPFLGYLLAAS